MAADEREKPKRCFVLSPIGAEDSAERKEADKVLKHLIRHSLEPEFHVERADDSTNPGSITPTIVAGVLEADLVVANLSGANPNVLYELAMAHGYDIPTVHIQRAGEKPPFDVKDMRIVTYTMDPDDLEIARSRLRASADYAIKNPEKVETPLTSATRFRAIHGSTDPVAESNVRVMEAIAEVHQDVKRALSRRISGVSSNVRLQQALAHARLTKMIIERVVDAGRAELSDFESAISPDSSEKYDDWARRQLAKVTGVDSKSVLNDILFDVDVRREIEDDGGAEDDVDPETRAEFERQMSKD
ncbi:hypothetical protein [Terrabacter sp. C0L_2]|uniref:hypothetical protein n=1 Tax=Terrabacter sp. C0L_2 TaxID=3108389 RepID=UPI002ED4EB7D|nr:hypothetical protein U5C87_05090 [Terrabacter sp. C0L_2]